MGRSRVSVRAVGLRVLSDAIHHCRQVHSMRRLTQLDQVGRLFHTSIRFCGPALTLHSKLTEVCFATQLVAAAREIYLESVVFNDVFLFCEASCPMHMSSDCTLVSMHVFHSRSCESWVQSVAVSRVATYRCTVWRHN